MRAFFVFVLFFFFLRHICVSAHPFALSDKIILSTLTTEVEGSGGGGGIERETETDRDTDKQTNRQKREERERPA